MDQNIFPNNIRTILLAYPKKTRRARKYVPPVYIPGSVDSGVRKSTINAEPVENWRLNQLSKARRKTEKWVFVPEEGVGTGIPRSALTIETSERSDYLSKPFIRKLICNRNLFKFTGEKFLANINKTLEQSWGTVYNFYKRQLLKKMSKKRKKYPKGTKRKDSKGKPLSDKEIIERRLKENAEICALLAKPKKLFPPAPLPKGKIADMSIIGARLTVLAEARHIQKKYIRPSLDPKWVEPLRVSEAAKKSVPSERVKELSTNPPHKVRKDPEKIPGVVIRGALYYKPSEKILHLSEPKKKANVTDNDLRENPYVISPTALKYTATARIRELAKPIER